MFYVHTCWATTKKVMWYVMSLLAKQLPNKFMFYFPTCVLAEQLLNKFMFRVLSCFVSLDKDKRDARTSCVSYTKRKRKSNDGDITKTTKQEKPLWKKQSTVHPAFFNNHLLSFNQFFSMFFKAAIETRACHFTITSTLVTRGKMSLKDGHVYEDAFP